MAAHYPANYYSFSASGMRAEPAWRRRLKTARLDYLFEGSGWLGRVVSPFLKVPPEMAPWLETTGVRQHSRVLDVGCGQGRLLRQMAGWGFTSLAGADPFVSGDLSFPDGVNVLRRALAEVTGEFDCIMMHHSFEHMNEQRAVLAEVRRLLAPNGRALIRIPLCSSAAFREYRTDWVQLDAPRHFYLHSRKSMESLAVAAGFAVERVVYDSTAFQFWGSEQYRRGVPLFSSESYAVNRKASGFSKSQIAALEARARMLNAQEDGDQACFILV
jgi:SAM-dependent methyltransferase